MKKRAFILMAFILISSCGDKPATELTPEQLNTISENAGMLARNLAYLPSDSSWSEAPDEALTAELELMAEKHTDVWPLFFRAAADTANKLEQLELQAQQEAIQAELL
ncbi:MAG: hypothetical protein KAH54_04700 [Candidatus Sabulitectum sp.]|nr:hypothetical protein [Candidatus Sabulitectum sp.]